MRGQRDKQALEAAKVACNAIEIIDVSEHKPRRIPSAKWRELINNNSAKKSEKPRNQHYFSVPTAFWITEMKTHDTNIIRL